MDIVAGIAAASQALDLVKKLREIDTDMKAAEVKLQMTDLYVKLADVRIALSDAQSEIKTKDAEIARLKEINEGKLNTFMHGGYRFGIDDSGNPLRKAFCPSCLTDGNQIMISQGLAGHDICPRCSGTYSAREVTLPVGFSLPNAAS
ncbi:hypothetical protein [Rhizobium rhizogenes]|uniref:hypothetical protein n=1 Tax=Rhizobium rhizogenes TaxID=359 RepID=UPI0022BE95FF|nr:hypothetical protein [Rhizobium rhizogenes]MCZ7488212.1 hypothetical protein [Rhizobium rhizogenes]